MNKAAEKICEAHVAFELEQWRGETLLKRLQEDIAAGWKYASSLKLKDVTDAKRISAIAQRRILDQPVSEELAATIGDIARHLIALPINKKTRLDEVISDELFESGVSLAADMHHIREQIIRQGVRSPVFEMLIADNLYQGIRDYVTKENLVTQKLPGVSKLIGRGTGALSKATGMGDKIDAGLRTYIDANVPKLVKQSEQFLQQALTDERIREVAGEIWGVARNSNLSIGELLRDDDIDALVGFGRESWGQLRESKYLHKLVAEGIGNYFKANGKRNLTELLADLNVDEAVLQQELAEMVPPVIDVMDKGGFLEATIRRRLEPFYADKATAKMLG